MSRSLKNSESTHEFYMAIWKVAPYSLITLLLAVLYAYPNDKDLSTALFAIFGWFLAFSVFSVDRVKLYGDRISTMELKVKDIESELRIRTEYTKAAFEVGKLSFSDHYSDYWSIPFSKDVSGMKRHVKYWRSQLGSERLKDMTNKYPRILKLMEEMETPSEKYLDKVQEFSNRVWGMVRGITPPVDESKLDESVFSSRGITQLYVSIVTNIEAAKQVDKLGMGGPDHVRDLKSFLNDKSQIGIALRGLVKNEDLRGIAKEVENKRMELNQKLSVIRGAIKYLFEQPR